MNCWGRALAWAVQSAVAMIRPMAILLLLLPVACDQGAHEESPVGGLFEEHAPSNMPPAAELGHAVDFAAKEPTAADVRWVHTLDPGTLRLVGELLEILRLGEQRILDELPDGAAPAVTQEKYNGAISPLGRQFLSAGFRELNTVAANRLVDEATAWALAVTRGEGVEAIDEQKAVVSARYPTKQDLMVAYAGSGQGWTPLANRLAEFDQILADETVPDPKKFAWGFLLRSQVVTLIAMLPEEQRRGDDEALRQKLHRAVDRDEMPKRVSEAVGLDRVKVVVPDSAQRE